MNNIKPFIMQQLDMAYNMLARTDPNNITAIARQQARIELLDELSAILEQQDKKSYDAFT